MSGLDPNLERVGHTPQLIHPHSTHTHRVEALLADAALLCREANSLKHRLEEVRRNLHHAICKAGGNHNRSTILDSTNGASCDSQNQGDVSKCHNQSRFSAATQDNEVADQCDEPHKEATETSFYKMKNSNVGTGGQDETSVAPRSVTVACNRSLAGVKPAFVAAGIKVSGDWQKNQESHRFKAANNSELFEAVSKKDLHTTRRILESGGSYVANSVDDRGVPVLYSAVQPGNAACILELLRANADPEAFIRICRWSALHRAAACGDTKIALLLLMFGADPNIKKSDGGTPLDLARRNNHELMVELLVQSSKMKIQLDKVVSLQLLCAMHLRERLSSKDIESLPIPVRLKYYLNHHRSFTNVRYAARKYEYTESPGQSQKKPHENDQVGTDEETRTEETQDEFQIELSEPKSEVPCLSPNPFLVNDNDDRDTMGTFVPIILMLFVALVSVHTVRKFLRHT